MPASESTVLHWISMLWEIIPQKCFALSWNSSSEGSNSRAPTITTLCNHIRNSPTTSGEDKPPQNSITIWWGKKNKRKEESNSRFSCQLNEKRGTPASATKHLSNTPNSNICFCPINCFHMGETHHSWLHSFQKSAFKVPHAQCDASFCLIISLTLTDLQKLHSQIPWEDVVPEGMRCAGLQNNTGSEHTTEFWQGAGKDLWWDKRIKHQLNTGIATLLVIFWGWTTLTFP